MALLVSLVFGPEGAFVSYEVTLADKGLIITLKPGKTQKGEVCGVTGNLMHLGGCKLIRGRRGGPNDKGDSSMLKQKNAYEYEKKSDFDTTYRR